MSHNHFFSRVAQILFAGFVFSFLTILALPQPAQAKLGKNPTYTTQFISEGYPNAINERGQIVGWQTKDKGKQAWFYSPDTGVTVLPLPVGYLYAEAIDINEAGVIIGNVYVDAGSLPEAVVWTPDQRSLSPRLMDKLPGSVGSMAVAINNRDQIVGVSLMDKETTIAFLYDAGMTINLLDHGFNAWPVDISDQLVIIGASIWMDVTTFAVTDLGVPQAKGITYVSSHLQAINHSNQAVGYAVQDTGKTTMVQYSVETGWQIIGNLIDNSLGYEMNQNQDKLAEVANFCPNAPKGSLAPVLFLNGSGNFCMKNLLAKTYQNWSIFLAQGSDINDKGQIVTVALNQEKGTLGTLLLSPLNP